MRVVPYYDQATLVAKCVATVTDALVQGIVLVALVLLLFMGGLRPSAVVALSIPFSILFAFIAMKVLRDLAPTSCPWAGWPSPSA